MKEKYLVVAHYVKENNSFGFLNVEVEVEKEKICTLDWKSLLEDTKKRSGYKNMSIVNIIKL